MYTAPATATARELDRRLPRSIGTWHRHVDFCGWPRGTPAADRTGPAARFGFRGSLHTQADCEAAGGYWIPVAFGWMTHVYPDASDPQAIWLGHGMHVD